MPPDVARSTYVFLHNQPHWFSKKTDKKKIKIKKIKPIKYHDWASKFDAAVFDFFAIFSQSIIQMKDIYIFYFFFKFGEKKACKYRFKDKLMGGHWKIRYIYIYMYLKINSFTMFLCWLCFIFIISLFLMWYLKWLPVMHVPSLQDGSTVHFVVTYSKQHYIPDV